MSHPQEATRQQLIRSDTGNMVVRNRSAIVTTRNSPTRDADSRRYICKRLE